MTIQNAFLFKLAQKFPILSKLFTFSDGFIPEDKETDYIFGANLVDKVVLQEGGQWEAYIPEDEVQHGRRVDTMGCTGYGLLNVMEILAKRLWNKEWNKSDRYTNKLSGTTTRGNTMSRVLESVRKNHGTVNEVDWDWDRDTFNWAEYYKTVPAYLKEQGLDWLEAYEIAYERVWQNKELFKESLKYSPLYVAGYAWYGRGGKYYSYGNANHVFCIVGYKEGDYWLAYDSYAPHLKKLDWNFNIPYAYVVTLRKRGDFNMKELAKLLEKGFLYLMRALSRGEMYRIDKSGLEKLSGKEASDLGITILAKDKKLLGIDETFYNRLINNL